MELKFLWDGKEGKIKEADLDRVLSSDPVEMADFFADIIAISEVMIRKSLQFQGLDTNGEH